MQFHPHLASQQQQHQNGNIYKAVLNAPALSNMKFVNFYLTTAGVGTVFDRL